FFTLFPYTTLFRSVSRDALVNMINAPELVLWRMHVAARLLLCVAHGSGRMSDTNPTTSTLHIIKREPLFVNPLVTKLCHFTQSTLFQFAFDDVIGMWMGKDARQWRAK